MVAHLPSEHLSMSVLEPSWATAQAVTAVAQDLAGEFSLRPLLERILLRCTELLGCDAGLDLQCRRGRRHLPQGSRHRHPLPVRSGLPAHRGMTGAVVARRGPGLVRPLRRRGRGGTSTRPIARRLRGVIGVPLEWRGVDHRRLHRVQPRRHADLLADRRRVACTVRQTRRRRTDQRPHTRHRRGARTRAGHRRPSGSGCYARFTTPSNAAWSVSSAGSTPPRSPSSPATAATSHRSLPTRHTEARNALQRNPPHDAGTAAAGARRSPIRGRTGRTGRMGAPRWAG